MPIPASRASAFSRASAAGNQLSGQSALSETKNDRDIYDTELNPVTGQEGQDGKEHPHAIKESICPYYPHGTGDFKPSKLGVSWNNLLVYGAEGGLKVHENIFFRNSTSLLATKRH